MDFIYLWNPEGMSVRSQALQPIFDDCRKKQMDSNSCIYVNMYAYNIYLHMSTYRWIMCHRCNNILEKKTHSITEVQKMYNSCSKAWEWVTSTPVFWFWTSNDLLSSCWFSPSHLKNMLFNQGFIIFQFCLIMFETLRKQIGMEPPP